MSLLVDWTPPHDSIVKVNCDASVYSGHHRTANAAADFLAKRAIEMREEYVELLEHLHNMRSFLWDCSSSSSVKS
ncbi:hypothetical protein PIB30_046849 [Stylosanthes scabra]|uniref:RNase H type-1 domain-containing protein n=1 Tax=Stylosanthes scabra TaxID=79078 RepID=A0ABU6XHI0_9FABA|nr:hypothetical protein [Stylosanthes scabra]